MGVGGVEFFQGDVNESMLDLQSFGVFILQFDNVMVCMVSKLWVSIESFFGILVELFDIGQVEIVDVYLFFDDVFNEYVELGVLVIDVILWDNGVFLSVQDMVEVVVDDGGMQVIDVYLFGDIGG